MNNIKELIDSNQYLIYSITSKYKKFIDQEELNQVAIIGLIKAFNNYNNKFNTKFSTYAYPYMLGEVLKYVNDYKLIKIPHDKNKLYLEILKCKETLTQILQRDPSNRELALNLNIKEQLVDELLNNNKISSLDNSISMEYDDLNLYNLIGYTENKIENIALYDALDKLSKDEQELIQSRYFANMTQSETAYYLGMYQVEVSRKETKILKKIKEYLK